MRFFFFLKMFFGIIFHMTAAQILDPEKLQKEVVELRCQIIHLEEQLAWFKRQIFGKKSEKIVAGLNEEQLQFEGFDAPVDEKKDDAQEVPAHQRRKPKRNGQDAITLDPNLPVKTTVIDIPEEEKICKKTGEPLVKIGEEVTHKLAHEPGSYYIKEIIRPKYAHPKQPEEGITTAFLPDSIIPKCRADDAPLVGKVKSLKPCRLRKWTSLYSIWRTTIWV